MEEAVKVQDDYLVDILIIDERSGEEMIFRMDRSTTFMKLMDAFRQRSGLDVKVHCKFVFDGRRVDLDDTPKLLELEDGDTFRAYFEQAGC